MYVVALTDHPRREFGGAAFLTLALAAKQAARVMANIPPPEGCEVSIMDMASFQEYEEILVADGYDYQL